MSNVKAAEAALATAAAEMAAAELHLKACDAELIAADKGRPRYTQTELAQDFARESQARRAGTL